VESVLAETVLRHMCLPVTAADPDISCRFRYRTWSAANPLARQRLPTGVRGTREDNRGMALGEGGRNRGHRPRGSTGGGGGVRGNRGGERAPDRELPAGRGSAAPPEAGDPAAAAGRAGAPAAPGGDRGNRARPRRVRGGGGRRLRRRDRGTVPRPGR